MQISGYDTRADTGYSAVRQALRAKIEVELRALLAAEQSRTMTRVDGLLIPMPIVLLVYSPERTNVTDARQGVLAPFGIRKVFD